jgi:hypothetical protein
MSSANPYDFITNPAAPAKKSLLGGGKRPLILGLVIAVVVVLLLAIGASLFGGGSSQDDYWTALRQHTETIRVSELGSDSARNNRAKNLAINTRQTLQSQQSTLNSLANAAGIKKIENKQLSLGQDSKTDERLTKADQLNQFDEEFIKVMGEELRAYQSSLKTLFDASSSQKNRATLSTMYDEVQLLVESTTQE